MRDLVLAALAAVAGFGLVQAWHYYATVDGPRLVRRLGCLAVVIGASTWAALLESHATGSAHMDTVLRIALVAAAGGGGAVASRGLLVVGAMLCTVVIVAAAASPLALLAAAGVGAAAALASLRTEHLLFSPFGAMTGASVGLFALDIRGIGRTGFPSLMAAFIVAPFIVAAWTALRRPAQVALGAALGLLVLAGVGATVALGVTAASARTDLDEAVRDARAGLDAAQDPVRRDEALTRLGEASSRFHALDADLGRWWVSGAVYVPVVGRYAVAGRSLVATGVELSGQAQRTVEAVDIDRLKPKAGRVDLAELRNVVAQLDDVRAVLARSSRTVGEVRSPWLLPVLEDQRAELGLEIDDALDSTADARDGAQVALTLLGGDGPRRILLMQVSNSESRAGGGWPGSFGVLEATDGVLDLVDVGRTGDALVASSPLRLDAPEDFVARYGFEDLTKDVRPFFLTPDFPTSSRLLVQAYQQISGRPIDAVIAMDAYGFASLLGVTGPVTVTGWPEPLTESNAAQVLLFGQYDTLGDDRSYFQEEATQAVFDRLTTGIDVDVSALIDTLAPAVEQGRIKFFAVDDSSERFFARVDAAGSMPPVRGDFLQLVTQNRVGNKIDWFLHRKVDYDVQYDPSTGAVRSKATVTLRNDAPSTGLSPLINGSLEGRPTQPGLNRLWLNLYSALDLTGATIDGQPLALESQRELGRRVYSAEVSIPAGQTKIVVVDLAGQLPAGSSYLLDVGRQPTVGADDLAVRLTVADGWRLTRADHPFTIAEGSDSSATALVQQLEPVTFAARAKPAD